MSTSSPVRAGDLEMRAAPNVVVDGRRLRGVIPYDVESRDLGGWRERMAAGCLAGADLGDLVATVDHAGVPLGRYPGTLAVEDRPDGLHWSVELPESRSDVREAIERGDLRASSWRMIVGRESWDGDVRTVHEVSALRDVAVVTLPAYPSATAELRQAPEAPQAPNPAPSAPQQEEPRMPEVTPTLVERPEDAQTDQRYAVVNVVREPAEPAAETGSARSDAGEPTEERSAPPAVGTLRASERTAAAAEAEPVKARVLEAMRSVPPGEARALSVSSSLAPGELSSYLFDRLRAASVALASGIQVISTDRDTVTFPRLTADVAPGWTAEAAPITPGDPTLDSLTATPRKLAHLTQFSNEVIDDSEPSAIEVVQNSIVKALGLKLDLGIFEGSGSAPEIRGLKNVAGINVVSLGTNGAQLTNLDPIADAIRLLEDANAEAGAIAMSPRTWNTVRKLKDSQNRPLVNVGTLDTPRSIYGVPVFVTSQLSIAETQGSASNASSIYVYQPDQVVLVRRQDIEIELDRSRLFNQDMSEMRGKLRADVLVPNPTAVTRVAGIIP